MLFCSKCKRSLKIDFWSPVWETFTSQLQGGILCDISRIILSCLLPVPPCRFADLLFLSTREWKVISIRDKVCLKKKIRMETWVICVFIFILYYLHRVTMLMPNLFLNKTNSIALELQAAIVHSAEIPARQGRTCATVTWCITWSSISLQVSVSAPLCRK